MITFCREVEVEPAEIESDNFDIDVHICDKSFFTSYKRLKFGVFKKLFQFIAFIWSIPGILKRYDSDQNTFLTVVGASIKPVCKAWILMKLAPRSKHCLYIVDDLELINKKYDNKFELYLIRLFLERSIRQADVLITISEGLKKLYKNKYDKDSTVLAPHFNKVPPLADKDEKKEREFVFLFTGGLNILYNGSLKFFASVIDDLNKKSTHDVIFKLVVQTYSSLADFRSLNFNEDYVSYSTSDNRDRLLDVYKQCDCFLIPYSFEEADHGLITTSFPQKIAEIIQYGRTILTLGPAYSSVNNFFVLNDLNYRCEEPSLDRLVEAITDILVDGRKFDSYYSAYNKYLSKESVIRIFNDIIKMKDQ
ncbi:glycosyltransferase family protein [Mucilaginibacter myungsuensis]